MIEAQIVVGEPNVDAQVDQVANLCPIPQVASTSVDLVNDEPVRAAAAGVVPPSAAELRATRPSCRLVFLEPFC